LSFLFVPRRDDQLKALFLRVSIHQPNRPFPKRGACLRVDSRCVLISIPTLLSRPYLRLASRPRKPPKFGPNVSPSANDPMLPSRSSASRSAARRRPSTSGNANSLLSPKPSSFCVCKPLEPTEDSIEIRLPEAGERLEAIGVREQPNSRKTWVRSSVGMQ
jgi:hypothetical protein